MADFDEAIKLEPQFGLAYWCRGLLYEKKKNLVAAKADMAKALRFDPNLASRDLKLKDMPTKPKPVSLVEVRSYIGFQGQVNRLAITPNGRIVIAGGNENRVNVWDVHTGKLLGFCAGHREPVWALAISPDGKQALSGGAWSKDSGMFKDSLRLWDLRTCREIRRFEGHTDVVALAFSADGLQALSGSNDGTLCLWDVKTGEALRRFQGHGGTVSCVTLTRDGRQALCASWDRTIRLWDVTTGRVIHVFEGHQELVTGVALSPDESQLLSGSLDKTMRLWDVKSGEQLRYFDGHQTGVTFVAWSPDGRRALSGSGEKLREVGGGYTAAGFDNCVRYWDVKTGHELGRHEGKTSALQVIFSPNGQNALYCGHSGTVKMLKLPK
jgi:WD40 repeat protein